jgi:hypothetical protein
MDADQIAAYIQQQIAAGLANVAAPIVAENRIKPTTPTSYSGEASEDVDLWIWLVDKWLTSGRVQLELEKITLASGLLRGPALAWWRNRETQPAPPVDWASFRAELKQSFQPINPVESFRDQLQVIRQTGSVLSYTTAFRNIVVNITTMTDEEKKFRFIYGLKPRTQEEVRMRNPSTFEEAAQIAARFDMVYRPKARHDTSGGGYYPHGPTPMELGAINPTANHYQKSYPNGQRVNNGQRFFSKRPNGRRQDHRGPKLKYELRQQLYKDGKCYHCQKTGHMWKDCPEHK